MYAKFTEKGKGWYQEIRTDQDEVKSLTFQIYADSFGLDKLLKDGGGKMGLEETASNKTKFIFTLYHCPKRFLGWQMNPVIKMNQNKNRLKVL